ncbi:MAG: cysteine desulfurase [Verrucomicrobia bacterium 61-8]|nr:cysteine desulfurase [Verrucomicrobiota bacterium]OJV01516.1 MAG: cysteine desulfurase [Verrucomicrobia bacterium 61-8]
MAAGERSWEEIRKDFPVLDQEVNGRKLIYFDNAATSQKPLSVIEAMTHYYEHDNANVHRGLHELSNRATAGYEGARARLAAYLGAQDEEIIFTRGTTESINLVARAWGEEYLKAGDVVLLTEMEHHSNIVPWQMLAQRRGVKLRFIPITPEGTLDLSNLDQLLDGVKLFSFVHISNSLGTINPAAELVRRAKAAGATVLVDAAQSAGHLPLDVKELGCDFLALSGHKMCGPTGIGLLYGRREILDVMPPFHGGGEMISTVTFEGSQYKPSPYRFEAGTPAIAEAIGLAVAAEYIDGIGRARIWEHDQLLAKEGLAVLSQIPGIRILGPLDHRAGLVAFTLQSAHAHDVVSMADQEGLALRGGHHCTQPLLRKLGVPASSRASFAFYNTVEEIHRMGEILKKVQTFFA